MSGRDVDGVHGILDLLSLAEVDERAGSFIENSEAVFGNSLVSERRMPISDSEKICEVCFIFHRDRLIILSPT